MKSIRHGSKMKAKKPMVNKRVKIGAILVVIHLKYSSRWKSQRINLSRNDIFRRLLKSDADLDMPNAEGRW